LSLQFSRSLRVLRLDSFRATRVGLLLAAALMALLIVWFFLARVTLYEVSSAIRPGVEGRLTVTFAPEALPRLRTGQAAWLRLELGGEGQSVRYPALVYDVPLEGRQVEVAVLSPDFPRDLSAERLQGQVEVEVAYVTPAELVMRTSERMLSRNQVPVSPQTPNEP
jgi:hypothetical protein